MTAALRRPHLECYIAFYYFYNEKAGKINAKKYTTKIHKKKL